MPFQIVRNDITKMQVDAIVNTANPFPGYGSGIASTSVRIPTKRKSSAKFDRIEP